MSPLSQKKGKERFLNPFTQTGLLPLFVLAMIIPLKSLQETKTSYLPSFCCSFHFGELSRVQLCNPMNSSPPGSSVHGILQASIPEWVAISFSRGFSQPRNWTWVSCIADGFFTVWATREAPLGGANRRLIVNSLTGAPLCLAPGNAKRRLADCNFPTGAPSISYLTTITQPRAKTPSYFLTLSTICGVGSSPKILL